MTPMKPTMDEAWVPFEVIVATTHRAEKNGGVALADSELMPIVDALNHRLLTIVDKDDETRPIRTNDLDATLVTLEDGERAVRLTGVVHPADLEAVGQIGFISDSSFEPSFEPLGLTPGLHRAASPLKLSANAGWFDDETIGEACSIMSELAPVEGARLRMSEALEGARHLMEHTEVGVILEMGLAFVVQLGPGLAANAVWDGLKYLLTHRQKRDGSSGTSRTLIELKTPLSTGEVIGIIDTSDPAVVSEALATYSLAVTTAAESGAKGGQFTVWKQEGPDRGWVSPA